MLNERRARVLSYDASVDALTVKSDDLGTEGGRSAQLLLDKKGFLVGVDVGEEPNRVVVMIGPHEAVARTEPARVKVTSSSVIVADAKRQARGHEKNPYV